MKYGERFKPTFFEKVTWEYTNPGLALGIALLWFFLGFWPMVIISATHTLFYVIILPGLINGWCHVRGYKNFPDAKAFNNRLISWITSGEGLHNNHHHDPKNPFLKYLRSEINLGDIFIKVFIFLKLAELTRQYPPRLF